MENDYDWKKERYILQESIDEFDDLVDFIKNLSYYWYVEIDYNPNEAMEFIEWFKDNFYKFGIKHITSKELYEQFKLDKNGITE